MHKIKIALFLLCILFCSQSNAEEASQEMRPSSALVNYPYLLVDTISNQGHTLSLNDGSEWDVDSFGLQNIDLEWNLLSLFGLGWKQKWTILNWDKGDSIEIQYPIGGNLFGFFMIITNLSKKEYAYVTIKNAPHYDHPSSLWIVNFDKVNENQFSILLHDGTQWLMSQGGNMYGTMDDQIDPSYLWFSGDILTLIRGESGIFGSDPYYLWNHSNNEILQVNKQDEPIQNLYK